VLGESLGPEEGALLKLGLLQGDKDGRPETLGDAVGEREGTAVGGDEGPELFSVDASMTG
jgi:hypothetical protein